MSSMFDLTGKVAVIAGASAGLGADASLAYAEAGADVALIARRIEKLEALKNEIVEKTGRKVITVQCDLTNEENVKAAVQTVFNAFGHIDILLNNAGVALHGGVDDMDTETWDKTFDTNIKSMYFTCKYVIPHMKEQKYGKVVNVSSVNAVVADKNDLFIRHAYNASKAAVIGLTTGMACSYAQYGITVNCVGPALFETEMTKDKLFKSEEFLSYYSYMNPAGRPGAKGELNGTIIYLSSDASSYVQGQFIVVDGGASIV